jgi:hypothetical protein
MKALTTEESEKHMKYIDLLANAVILDNTFQLSKVLKGLIEEGWSIIRDELAMLSSYMTHHVKRFGNYVMDLETLPETIEDDLPFPVSYTPRHLMTSTFHEKSRSLLQIALIPTISLSGRYLCISCGISAEKWLAERFWAIPDKQGRLKPNAARKD